MKRILAIISLIMLLSCGESEGTSQETTIETKTQNKDLVWICHNPNTRFHDKECVEGTYPEGCYVEDDRSAFCWVLLDSDCEAPHQLKWQQKYCPLLKKWLKLTMLKKITILFFIGNFIGLCILAFGHYSNKSILNSNYSHDLINIYVLL